MSDELRLTREEWVTEIRNALGIDAQKPGGTECPACEQHVQVYKRKIHASMAAMLIAMYRKAPVGTWIYLPDLPQKSRDGTGLAFWGLIEEERQRREDGGRAGYWRVTWKGRRFVEGHVPVRKYAYVYNGRVLTHEGEHVYIENCLGNKFDYRELMEG
jgi:hypothetical protein